MRPFRNTGWKLYKKMLKMSPGTAAKGTHLYSPLTSTSVCSHPNIIESSTDPFMSTFSNVSTGIPDFPIDIDHPDSLDVTTGGSTDNLSTTLVSSTAAARGRPQLMRVMTEPISTSTLHPLSWALLWHLLWHLPCSIPLPQPPPKRTLGTLGLQSGGKPKPSRTLR